MKPGGGGKNEHPVETKKSFSRLEDRGGGLLGGPSEKGGRGTPFLGSRKKMSVFLGSSGRGGGGQSSSSHTQPARGGNRGFRKRKEKRGVL